MLCVTQAGLERVHSSHLPLQSPTAGTQPYWASYEKSKTKILLKLYHVGWPDGPGSKDACHPKPDDPCWILGTYLVGRDQALHCPLTYTCHCGIQRTLSSCTQTNITSDTKAGVQGYHKQHTKFKAYLGYRKP